MRCLYCKRKREREGEEKEVLCVCFDGFDGKQRITYILLTSEWKGFVVNGCTRRVFKYPRRLTGDLHIPTYTSAYFKQLYNASPSHKNNISSL